MINEKKIILCLSIILLICLFSCKSKTERISIPNNFFSVPFVQEQNILFGSEFTSFFRFYKNSEQNYFFTKAVYNESTELHNFKNLHQEIQYSRGFIDTSLRIYELNFYDFYIAINNEKCFYLIWPSKLYEEIASKIDFEFINYININSQTEYIYTNLNKKEISYLLPQFKGKIIDGEVEKIMLDTNMTFEKKFCGSDFYNLAYYNRIRYIGLTDKIVMHYDDYIRQEP